MKRCELAQLGFGFYSTVVCRNRQLLGVSWNERLQQQCLDQSMVLFLASIVACQMLSFKGAIYANTKIFVFICIVDGSLI